MSLHLYKMVIQFPPNQYKKIVTFIANGICEKDLTGCTALESVILPREIDKYSFAALPVGCKLTQYSVNPPSASYFDFDGNTYKSSTLYVPQTSVARYRADRNWGKFEKIEAIETAGSDATNTTENGIILRGNTLSNHSKSTCNIHTLNGKICASVKPGYETPLNTGIYIAISGGKSHKIIVK